MHYTRSLGGRASDLLDSLGGVMFEIDNARFAATILRVRGEIDFGSSDDFRDALRLALDGCAERLIVVLDDCTYFDCSGIRTLVAVRREIGRRLKVVVPRGRVTHRVFEILGLIEPLEVVATVEDALQRPIAPHAV